MRKHQQQNSFTTISTTTTTPAQLPMPKKVQQNIKQNSFKEEDKENGCCQNGDSHKQQNGAGNTQGGPPPKPLPRASRQSSLTDSEEIVVGTLPRPVARPRMSATLAQPPTIGTQPQTTGTQVPSCVVTQAETQLPPTVATPPSTVCQPSTLTTTTMSSVVTSVNPLAPISGGYKVRDLMQHVFHQSVIVVGFAYFGYVRKPKSVACCCIIDNAWLPHLFTLMSISPVLFFI